MKESPNERPKRERMYYNLSEWGEKFEAFGLEEEETGLNRNITFSQRCN